MTASSLQVVIFDKPGALAEGEMMKVPRLLAGPAKTLVAISILLFIALVSYADYFTPMDYTFSVFLLIPVSIGALLLGKRESIVMAVVSVAALFAVHLVHGRTYGAILAHLWEAFTQLVVLLVITYILVALRRTSEREAALARADPLTGISNRRSFAELGEYEIRRSQRFGQPLSVVCLDIDNFKEVNDKYGHRTGDELLKIMADTIKENIRSVDTVARMGGDEFAIILPAAGYEETDEVVQRIRSRTQHLLGERGWSAGISVGAVTCPVPTCPIEAMLRNADDLMYQVKRSGKNSYQHVLMQNSSKALYPGKKVKETVKR